MLTVKYLSKHFDGLVAVKDLSFDINQGEILALLGANGAGKSTTLNAICGIFKATDGSIEFKGEPIHRLPTHAIVARGVAQVPEGRRVFGTLTVRENLNLGAFTSNDKDRNLKNLRRVYDLFPRLAQRTDQLAGTLSGGEQQMLAIGRALMAEPKILLLDEPSLGLAPLLVKAIFQTIREINASGLTVMLVEQNARAALKLAHRGYVMEVGNIVLEDTAVNLLANPDVRNAYLGGGRTKP